MLEKDLLEDEALDNFIYLDDEDGNSCRFELLDVVFYQGREFMVLLSDEEAQKEESDVDILEVVADPKNPELENYIPVDSDKVIDAVFQLFVENNKDTMDFV